MNKDLQRLAVISEARSLGWRDDGTDGYDSCGQWGAETYRLAREWLDKHKENLC